MTIEIVNTLPLDEWYLYLEHHPNASIFHTPEMFQVFNNLKNYTPKLWAAVDDEAILALLLPVNVTIKDGFGLLRPLTTRSVVYGGLLHTPTSSGVDALGKLLATYIEQLDQTVLFTEIRNLTDETSIQTLLTQHQFQYEGHLNYLIDVSLPVDQIMKNIGKRTRKQIRNAINKNIVTVEVAQTLTDVQECYQLIQKSYTAAQIYLAEFSFFEAVFERLHPLGLVQFWLARINGKCVASSIELPYKERVYGWYSGVDRDYSKYYPGELLMWHVLKWCGENGYKIYDFGGAGRPDEEYGVRKFKAKFGGDLVNYGRNIFIHRPMTLQVSKLGYEVYRRLR